MSDLIRRCRGVFLEEGWDLEPWTGEKDARAWLVLRWDDPFASEPFQACLRALAPNLGATLLGEFRALTRLERTGQVTPDALFSVVARTVDALLELTRRFVVRLPLSLERTSEESLRHLLYVGQVLKLARLLGTGSMPWRGLTDVAKAGLALTILGLEMAPERRPWDYAPAIDDLCSLLERDPETLRGSGYVAALQRALDNATDRAKYLTFLQRLSTLPEAVGSPAATGMVPFAATAHRHLTIVPPAELPGPFWNDPIRVLTTENGRYLVAGVPELCPWLQWFGGVQR